MSHPPADDIIKGYVEEVHTHIPDLAKGLAKLRKNADQPKILDKILNIAQMMRGASAMVGIVGLSAMAGELADALQAVKDGRPAFSGPVADALETAVGQVKAYCDRLVGEGTDPRRDLRDMAVPLRAALGLPRAGDGLDAAAADLPEFEGLSGQDGPDLSGMSEEELLAMLGEDGETPGGDEPLPEPVAERPAPKPAPSAPTPPANVPPELVESFFEESSEHLEELDDCLETLESRITGPTPLTDDLKEVIRRVRRAVHTLKGAAAVIGLSNISVFGHKFEDFLDWLYETATTASPDIVSLLMASGDLMHRIVEDSSDPRSDEVEELRRRYEAVTGATGEAEPGPAGPSVLLAGGTEEEDHADGPSFDPHAKGGGQVLRVRADRLDELVNLTGEMIIGGGVFEQQLHRFDDILEEMKTARGRLREIARELEVEYEVRALSGMGYRPGDRRLSGIRSSEMEQDFDTLELDRYTGLSMIIRTLNESAIDMGTIYTRLTHLFSEVDGHVNRQRVLSSEIQDKLMRVRMLPLGALSGRLRRMVRETATRLGKKIRLKIEGEEIELDRLFWDRLADPLLHMVRNAADHGIEPEAERRSQGKPPTATLKVAARREGNQVVIRVSDDGAGLNWEKIRRKAIRSGLLKPDAAPGEEELAALIFEPGFSTAEAITDVSGRGVGMDVVRENIRELKGTVRVSSVSGQGTQFTIRIPLTLAAVRALLFTLGGRVFAIALGEIREIVRVEPRQIMEQPQRSVRVGDEIIPLYHLAEILGIPSQDRRKEAPRHHIVLVLRSGDTPQAILIEGILGQREIVIKNTGSHLRHVKGIAGVTIDGDGSVVPILNMPELIGGGPSVSTSGRGDEFDRAAVHERPLSILVVDDSVSIRQVVSRMITGQGWEPRTAKDGIDALEKLSREGLPDMMILDIEMPRMNGYELLAALAAEPRYREVPVVMLTSRATAKHQEKAISLGAKAFMFKPYNENEFVDLILRLV